MAFNIVARIDDLLYVDDITKHSDRFPLAPMVSKKKVSQQSQQVSVSDTQHNKTTFGGTPSCSPVVPLISPSKVEITPFIRDMIKPQRRGFGVKRALSNYLGGEMKAAKVFSNLAHEVNGSNTICNKIEQGSQMCLEEQDKMIL
jgi:hypothetical protein